MAREVYRFSVTVPAGTLQAAPQLSPLPMPPRIVSRVEIKVPPGPHGLVGFQLASGGAQMIPINAGAFVTADDDLLAWDLDGQIDSGAWQMIAYNLGGFNHTLEVRFFTDLTAGATVSAAPALIESTALSS